MKKYKIRIKECEESKDIADVVHERLKELDFQASSANKILFIKYPGQLSQVAYLRIIEALHKQVGEYFEKILILESGLDLGVLEIIEDEETVPMSIGDGV